MHQRSKTCNFFIKNHMALHLLFAGTWIRIWGNLYFAGIALQLYSTLRFEWLKWIQKLRAIPWEFWDEVFSLSMPSVCPHLTTVYVTSGYSVWFWSQYLELALMCFRRANPRTMLLGLLIWPNYFYQCWGHYNHGKCDLYLRTNHYLVGCWVPHNSKKNEVVGLLRERTSLRT